MKFFYKITTITLLYMASIASAMQLQEPTVSQQKIQELKNEYFNLSVGIFSNPNLSDTTQTAPLHLFPSRTVLQSSITTINDLQNLKDAIEKDQKIVLRAVYPNKKQEVMQQYKAFIQKIDNEINRLQSPTTIFPMQQRTALSTQEIKELQDNYTFIARIAEKKNVTVQVGRQQLQAPGLSNQNIVNQINYLDAGIKGANFSQDNLNDLKQLIEDIQSAYQAWKNQLSSRNINVAHIIIKNVPTEFGTTDMSIATLDEFFKNYLAQINAAIQKVSGHIGRTTTTISPRYGQ